MIETKGALWLLFNFEEQKNSSFASMS